MSMNTSMIERENYIAIDKGYEDITIINPYDYNLTIGLTRALTDTVKLSSFVAYFILINLIII